MFKTLTGFILLLIVGCQIPTNPPCPPVTRDTIYVRINCDTFPPVDTTGNSEILIGINTNVWQPADKQSAFQTTRLYLPTGWVYTSTGFRGQPFLNGGKQFYGSDEYLTYMKAQGVDVLLTLMDSPTWLNQQQASAPSFLKHQSPTPMRQYSLAFAAGELTNNFPPIRPGAKRDDPASYREFAAIYGAFAMRYGSKSWPAGSYPLDNAQPRWNGDGPQVHKSGMGLVKFIEGGNEWDRWWDKGTGKYLTAQEHAALLLACYDAIKFADPEMRVVMGGLTNYDLPYLKEMQAWFTARGRAFAADVINVHHYASYGNLPGIHPPTWKVNEGAPPELDKDFQTVSQVVSWAKAIGKPVWVSEYGYDTQAGSQMYIQPFAGQTSEEIQAQMVVRATLEYLRLGVQRTYLFTIADEPNPSGTFTSSGVLFGEPRGYAPKPSFNAMASLCSTLKGTTKVTDRSTQTIRIVEFETPKGRVYYYWTPTAEGKSFGGTVNGRVVTVTETPQWVQ